MTAADLTRGALIAVDWGTSRLRATLLDVGGTPLAEAESEDGIGTLSGGHEVAFERLTAGWPKVPAIMAGMVGSQQGWREAPYVSCPASPETLAGNVLRFATAAGRPMAIVPGVMLLSPDRDGDVIRGEETQIVGLLTRDAGWSGTVILPGTHSKWASVEGGAITGFQTFLTGELFGLLARQSFLRHSVAERGDVAGSPDFALAVQRMVEAGLPFLAAIFSVRARALLAAVKPEDNFAYLSGLVIGGEIAAAQASGAFGKTEPIRIIGTRSLAAAYRKAFEVTGRKTEALDGSALVVAGLVHIARNIGLLAAEAS